MLPQSVSRALATRSYWQISRNVELQLFRSQYPKYGRWQGGLNSTYSWMMAVCRVPVSRRVKVLTSRAHCGEKPQPAKTSTRASSDTNVKIVLLHVEWTCGRAEGMASLVVACAVPADPCGPFRASTFNAPAYQPPHCRQSLPSTATRCPPTNDSRTLHQCTRRCPSSPTMSPGTLSCSCHYCSASLVPSRTFTNRCNTRYS